MKRLRVPAQYLPVFCRELYQLVRSGIPLGEGLAMLREDETDPDARSWLDALCRFVQDSDVSWGQVHDILSNRSRSDPAIDGAYSAAIQEGILWPLYEKNPQRYKYRNADKHIIATEKQRQPSDDHLTKNK